MADFEPNHRLAALREARNKTLQQVAEKLLDLIEQDTGKRTGLDADYLSRLERGLIAWPRVHTRKALRTYYQVASDDDLGLHYRRTRTPHTSAGTAPSTETGDPTNRRTALAALGAAALAPILMPSSAAAEAADFTRHATDTELGPGTLDRLQAAVHQLGATYPAHRPQELWPTTLELRRQTHALTQQRHTLRQGRSLAHTAGMLSVVLAWLAHDLGDTPTAEAYCADARTQGQQADLPEVCAWSDDAHCTILLYADRPDAALAAAVRGMATTPRDSNAHARLAAQVTRAHARLGHADDFTDAAKITRAYADRLPAHGAGLFGADAVRIASYDASSHLWLGQPNKARTAAEAAVAQYTAVADPRKSPTRMAIAQLDLAAAYAALGEPDGAVEFARQALNCPRLVDSVCVRAHQLGARLRRDYPRIKRVGEFANELSAVTAPVVRA